MYRLLNTIKHNEYTHSKISNCHFTFYASFESKIRLNIIHASINKPKVYRDTAGHFV